MTDVVSVSNWINLLQGANTIKDENRYIALSEKGYCLKSDRNSELPIEKIYALSKEVMAGALTQSKSADDIGNEVYAVRNLTRSLIDQKKASETIKYVSVSFFCMLGIITIPLAIWILADTIKMRKSLDAMKKDLNDSSVSLTKDILINDFMKENFVEYDSSQNVGTGMIDSVREAMCDTLETGRKNLVSLGDCLAVGKDLREDLSKIFVSKQFLIDNLRAQKFEILDGMKIVRSKTSNDGGVRLLSDIITLEEVASATKMVDGKKKVTTDRAWELIFQSLISQTTLNPIGLLMKGDLMRLVSDGGVISACRNYLYDESEVNFESTSPVVKISLERDEEGNIVKAYVFAEDTIDLIVKHKNNGAEEKDTYVEMLRKDFVKGSVSFSVAIGPDDKLVFDQFSLITKANIPH